MCGIFLFVVRRVTVGSQKNQTMFPSPWSVAGSGVIYVAKSWEEVMVFLASRGVEGLVPMGARLPTAFSPQEVLSGNVSTTLAAPVGGESKADGKAEASK